LVLVLLSSDKKAWRRFDDADAALVQWQIIQSFVYVAGYFGFASFDRMAFFHKSFCRWRTQWSDKGDYSLKKYKSRKNYQTQQKHF